MQQLAGEALSRAGGIVLWQGILSRHIVNNTFYNTRGGVLAIFDGPVHLNNNIFNSIRLNDNSSHISVSHPGRAGLSSQDGNTFDVSASFRWWNSERVEDGYGPENRGETFTLLGYTTFYPTQCTTCTENVSPLFVDPTQANFRLQAESPLIDESSESYVYQRFFGLYGIDIRVDFDGNPRPSGDGWEAGAFEYYPSETTTPVIVNSSLYDAQLDAAYTVKLYGYGGELPYTWTLENGSLPSGMSFDSDGNISGTPSQTGNFTIDVMVTDSIGVSSTKVLSITVREPNSGSNPDPDPDPGPNSGSNPEPNPDDNNEDGDEDEDEGGSGAVVWILSLLTLPLLLRRRRM